MKPCQNRCAFIIGTMCYNQEYQSLDRVSVAFILSKNAADRTTLLVYKKVLSEDVQFFLVYERKEGSNTTKSGPSSTHEQNGVSLADKCWPNVECWLSTCSFVIFPKIWTSIAEKPYRFVIFRGVGRVRTTSPPLSSSSQSEHSSLQWT